ncbi:hypothetical protein B2J88_36270 [Rhodococcus sp. SRB_17]|nr:hypothetical protein [Rhodococcus sp. SRB_17]
MRLVVPRHLCTYQRIECDGVPRLKLSSFAKLQVQALAPFSNYGSCAVHQANWLHVWVWDAAIESAFSKKHGNKQHFSALPHSLYSTPKTSGIVWLASAGNTGLEGQLWKEGHLIDSMWFDAPPDADTWAALHAQTPGVHALGWPLALPSRGVLQAVASAPRPWGRNLTPRSQNRPRIQWVSLAPAALVAATTTLVGGGSWIYSEKEAHQEAINQGHQSQERLLAELEPMQQARQRTTKTLGWINTVQTLSPVPSTHSVITELADILTRQGLVVRELDINAPTVQATLVATAGGSPRLTAVLGALENHPWFYDARFVDVSGGTGFKFAWRLRAQAPTSPEKGQP